MNQPISASDTSAPGPLAIVGPTASGKSSLGIALAEQLKGEIINCDSVQVYKDLQIATAKVPLDQRLGIPHHLLDFVPLNVNYTAVEWAAEALKKIGEIESRGALPILVGGSGFYLRALRQPFFPSPSTNAQLRHRLNEIRLKRGADQLHRILRRLDPPTGAELHPRDWPRVQRAIEVLLQTGRPISEQKQVRPAPHASTHKLRILALNPPRAELYRRVNSRTEAHFSAGLVEEVQDLLLRGAPATSNALGAHGYRRVVEYLHGRRTLASAIEETKLDIRHYAKRQLTWFRREPGVEWFEGFGDDKEVQIQVRGAIRTGVSTKTA